MVDETRLEVHRQLRDAQDKYTYFLLTAAGAGVALAVNQTRGEALMWSHIPLGMALAMWASSFYFGCRHLAYISSFLYANAALLRLQAGEDPEIGMRPQLIEAAGNGIKSALEENSESANRLGKRQFRFLVGGGVLYVAWHILEMYLRSAMPAA